MQLSVVMAVRNGEPYIRDAIESVLSQSVGDFEFLIVDDGSTDTTRDIALSYQRQDARVRLLCNDRNLGPYPSANRALQEARGEFVARHDADDISASGRFAIQLAALGSGRETSLVTGGVEAFDARGAVSVVRPPPWQPRLEWELLFSNVVGAGAHVMFPRLVQGRPVQFPATHRYAEDYGMWCRLARLGRVVCPPETVYRYRQHESSITTSRKAEQAACFADQRLEYQTLFLDRDAASSASGELSRFWLARAASSLPENVDRLGVTLGELRASFLTDVERRYSRADRETLERDIDEALVVRITEWLARAIRRTEVGASRDLMALSGRMGVRRRVAEQLFARIATVARRKLTQPEPIARHPAT